jgi:hypothetical protein
VGIDQDRETYKETIIFQKKKVAQDCKITDFDRMPALFNGASMEAIT